MRAVERLRDRLAQRRALRVIDDHRRPGNGLECDPMQPDRATERENGNDATDAAEHGQQAIEKPPVRQPTEARSSTQPRWRKRLSFLVCGWIRT